SKSERSGTGVDMANLSKAVCHGDQINADSGIRRRSQTFRDLVLALCNLRHFSRPTPTSLLPLRTPTFWCSITYQESLVAFGHALPIGDRRRFCNAPTLYRTAPYAV